MHALFEGTALKQILPAYNLKRSDIFITTKLKTSDFGKEKTRPAFMKSLEQLQCDYIDLYLIHYPAPSWQAADAKKPTNKEIRQETWLELEKIKGFCNKKKDNTSSRSINNKFIV